MAPTIQTIRRYHTHREITIDFFGKELLVTETDTPSVIRRWINSVLFNHRRYRSHLPLVVGVGVYWTPNLTNSDEKPPVYYYYDSDSSSSSSYPAYRYSNPSPPPDPEADTLQLCVGRRIIIIKLTHCDRVPRALRRFLVDPRTTYVGVWNAQDEKKLALSRHKLEIGELLDVKNYVSDSDGNRLNGCSFEVIVEECLGLNGVYVDEDVSKSDWSKESLDRDQILQASVDAHVCFELGVSFRLWEV